ncbi:MAG TPA: hypothetical protein VLA04_04220 [Verrucomicrobiae bacterium]|nr:hypothetical protein [Verrucomicrobiae bacterium]
MNALSGLEPLTRTQTPIAIAAATCLVALTSPLLLRMVGQETLEGAIHLYQASPETFRVSLRVGCAPILDQINNVSSLPLCEVAVTAYSIREIEALGFDAIPKYILSIANARTPEEAGEKAAELFGVVEMDEHDVVIAVHYLIAGKKVLRTTSPA